MLLKDPILTCVAGPTVSGCLESSNNILEGCTRQWISRRALRTNAGGFHVWFQFQRGLNSGCRV